MRIWLSVTLIFLSLLPAYCFAKSDYLAKTELFCMKSVDALNQSFEVIEDVKAIVAIESNQSDTIVDVALILDGKPLFSPQIKGPIYHAVYLKKGSHSIKGKVKVDIGQLISVSIFKAEHLQKTELVDSRKRTISFGNDSSIHIEEASFAEETSITIEYFIDPENSLLFLTDNGPRLPLQLKVRLSAKPLKDLVMEYSPPTAFVSAAKFCGHIPYSFEKIYQNGGMEVLDSWEEASPFDSNSRSVKIKLEKEYFTDQRNRKAGYEAIILISSLPK